MKHLATLLIVVGCGKSDKAASSDGSWKIGGISVPNAAIPQKLGVPTVLEGKIGDELLAGDLYEMAMVVPDQLNVSYVLGDYPDDDLVRGYQAMIYVDPLPALEATWGPSTEKAGTSYDLARCWTAADAKLEACVFKHDTQNHWYVTTVTTAPLPARPVTPVPPEPPGTYDDYPVGIGPCVVAGIKEISEIAGVQMQYLAPEVGDRACHLVPATSKAAARAPGQVTTAEAIAQVPDVLIARDDAKRASWSAHPLEGLGERAAWDGKSVVVQVKDHVYRISVTDPKKSLRVLRDRALQIARKVVARAQAAPPE